MGRWCRTRWRAAHSRPPRPPRPLPARCGPSLGGLPAASLLVCGVDSGGGLGLLQEVLLVWPVGLLPAASPSQGRRRAHGPRGNQSRPGPASPHPQVCGAPGTTRAACACPELIEHRSSSSFPSLLNTIFLSLCWIFSQFLLLPASSFSSPALGRWGGGSLGADVLWRRYT